jgi:FkbM family methyltransferase
VRTRRCFFDDSVRAADTHATKTDPPPVDEEYFEWVDVLEAVAEARGTFVMMELGAGYGRWLARAAAAVDQIAELSYILIGVEAEPTHFGWMGIHMRDNGVDLSRCDLRQAAVAAHSGDALFMIGDAASWYGQRIAGEDDRRYLAENDISTTTVPTIVLNSLLEEHSYVDLLDLDIQGAELEVLSSSRELLDARVRRVHIGTHGSDIEDGLRNLFGELRWDCLNDYPLASTCPTPWGSVAFTDGVQSWLNPRARPSR